MMRLLQWWREREFTRGYNAAAGFLLVSEIGTKVRWEDAVKTYYDIGVACAVADYNRQVHDA